MSLGPTLHSAFLRAAQGKSVEVALFRALQDAFNGSSGSTLVEEYHGSRSQVKFTRIRRGGRLKPRCELADLLLINYSANDSGAERMTWLQAKVTKKAYLLSSPSFAANLEQWDLLGNRPQIEGAFKRFSLPSNLLSCAVLPSIGSFGVFYPADGTFDMAYFSGDTLVPVNDHQSERGTLKFVGPRGVRNRGLYDELVSAHSLLCFGNAIEHGIVGSPIQKWLSSHVQDNGPQPQQWMGGLLKLLQRRYPNALLPNDLYRQLGLPDDIEPLDELPSRSVVLVRFGKGESKTDM